MPVKILFDGIECYGDTFRRIVAKQSSKLGIEIPCETFHYRPGGGTNPNVSPIRWCGNGRSVWINAVTDDAEKLLLPHVVAIARCLGEQFGRVPATKIIDLNMQIEPIAYDAHYRLHNMIMSVDAPKGDTAAIRKAVVKNVGKHIASSFKTQSEQLGLFVPEFMVDESAYSTIIIDAIVPYPVRPHESEVGRWLMAVNATMSVQARIPSGAWAVGRMLSRGKGIITRTRSAA